MVVERDPSKVDFTKDGKIKLYPDEPTSQDNIRQFNFKEDSKFFDPCAEASQMSMSCLERNDYDRKKCKAYFEIYRDCMAAWKRNRRENRR